MNLTFKWDKGFQAKNTQMFKRLENTATTKIVEYMTPYVPVARDEFKNRGQLRDSVTISKNNISYRTRFSRADYYSWKNHLNGGNKKAVRMWFEYAKKKHKSALLKDLKSQVKRK